MSPSKSRRRRPRKKKSNKRMILVAGLLAVVVVAVVVASVLSRNDLGARKVRLVTNMGNILIELRDDMPITTKNFKNLVQQGVYDGTIFHRVVNLPQNLVIIQGGDPATSETWSGGAIPSIRDEFTDNNKNERGTIAMANTGAPNSGSSQFFINVEYNEHLDDAHPVFGRVIEGMDVVDQIAKVETDENDRPIEDVRINIAELED